MCYHILFYACKPPNLTSGHNWVISLEKLNAHSLKTKKRNSMDHNVPIIHVCKGACQHCWNFSWDILRLLRQLTSSAWTYVFTHYDTSEARTHASWSIKVSIAAQKFTTSTLMTASLKVVTIQCIEHDVTCLNERVFIKTKPFTDQL